MEDDILKGILVVKVYCGNLPVKNAVEFVNKFRETYEPLLSRVKNNGYDIMFIPSLIEDTSISKIDL